MYFADSKTPSSLLFLHSRILPITMLSSHLVSSMMHDINNQSVPPNISMVFTHSEQVHHHFTRFSAAGNPCIKGSKANQLLFSFVRILLDCGIQHCSIAKKTHLSVNSKIGYFFNNMCSLAETSLVLDRQPP